MIAERFQTKEKCQVEVYGTGSKVIRGEVRNLSKTGALVRVYRDKNTPKKGDLLNLVVVLDELNRQYSFAAEVVWCDDLKLGLNFVSQSKVYERLMAKPDSKS